MLQTHFSNAANETRDSTERAKHKGLHDVLTSVCFVFNLGVRFDLDAPEKRHCSA